MRRSDDEIRKDLLDHLKWDTRLDASSVNVTVEGGVVTLRGEVPTFREQSLAADVSWTIGAVRDVVNEISVRDRTGAPLPADEELLDRINTLFEWNPQINDDDIEASVFQGVVTLEGPVDAHWKRRYVEELIGSLEGVVDIHNGLAVVPNHEIEDQLIAEDVVTALRRSILVDADDIEVRVVNGEVTLSGQVSSLLERKAAEEAASTTAGVVAIHNRITVSRAAA